MLAELPNEKPFSSELPLDLASTAYPMSEDTEDFSSEGVVTVSDMKTEESLDKYTCWKALCLEIVDEETAWKADLSEDNPETRIWDIIVLDESSSFLSV